MPMAFLQLVATCLVVILWASILVVFVISTMSLIHVSILVVLEEGIDSVIGSVRSWLISRRFCHYSLMLVVCIL